MMPLLITLLTVNQIEDAETTQLADELANAVARLGRNDASLTYLELSCK